MSLPTATTRRDRLVLAFGAVACAASGLVYMLGTKPVWQGVWSQTFQSLRSSILLSGPLLLAVAVWMGGAERRNGLGALLGSAPRSAPARTCPLVALTLLSGLAGLSVVVGVAAIMTLQTTPLDLSQAGLVLVTYAMFVGFALGGFGLGQRWSWPLLPPAAVVAAYAVMAALNSVVAAINLQPVDERDLTAKIVPGLLVAVWVVWFAVVGLAVLALCWRRRVVSTAALCLAAVCGVNLVHLPNDPFTADAAAAEPRCRPTTPVPVCVSTVHGYLARVLVPLAQQAAAPLVGTPLLPTRYEENTSGPSGRSGRIIYFYTLDGQRTGSATVGRMRQLDLLASFTFSHLNCAAPPRRPDGFYRVNAADVVEGWYRQQLHLSPILSADPAVPSAVDAEKRQITRFAELSSSVRLRWLSENAGRLLTCRVPLSELP